MYITDFVSFMMSYLTILVNITSEEKKITKRKMEGNLWLKKNGNNWWSELVSGYSAPRFHFRLYSIENKGLGIIP